jgi:FKBP-type peptidyl-prolyl cis-trans isomerase
MKYQLLLLLALLLFFSACQSGEQPSEEKKPRETTRTIDAAEAATPDLAEDDLLMKLSAFLIAEPQTRADSNRNIIVNYAIDKGINVDLAPSGLFYQVLDPGEGRPLSWGERVSVHYRGYFLDGKEFDSSFRRNSPVKFYVGNMIDGWNEGMQLLRPKGRALFLVPSELAYGAAGIKLGEDDYLVPPDANLAFEVAVQDRVK